MSELIPVAVAVAFIAGGFKIFNTWFAHWLESRPDAPVSVREVRLAGGVNLSRHLSRANMSGIVAGSALGVGLVLINRSAGTGLLPSWATLAYGGLAGVISGILNQLVIRQSYKEIGAAALEQDKPGDDSR